MNQGDPGENTLTHKDLAREVGVSETTIKSYRRKFPTFIPVAGYGKPIRFRPEALAVCQAIRQAFERGSSVLETERGLKERFPEHPENRPRSPRRGASPDPGLSAALNTLLERFTQAQTVTEQRLERLENSLAKLLDMDAENKARLNRLLERLSERPLAEPGKEPRVKAKKIVNVRTPEGRVDSYALEDEPAPPEQPAPAGGEAAPAPDSGPGPEPAPGPGPGPVPDDEFLDLPAVIQAQGEFLGLPGRLRVRAFAQVLERMGQEARYTLVSWVEEDEGWRFCLTRGGGPRLEHLLVPTTTPRGNRVAEFSALTMDGRVAEPQELVDYFKDVKTWL